MARIGKNVLESLTRSMYADSRCVYREYIQNAADQIDEAKKEHPEWEYNVFVTIDQHHGSITIEDNATGVRAKDVRALLIDVARSAKERGVNKGFRGIGRLGGLAYCKTLKFETSYYNEDKVSVISWDAVRLNKILDDDTDDRDAGEVIDDITKVSTEQDKSVKECHYFKVVMEDVTDGKLLIEKDIRDYLSMVSPVDYSNHFVYRTKIYDFMRAHNLHLDCYNIFVGQNQLFKDYTMTIYDAGGQECDKVTGVEFWYEQNAKGKPMYWGWYSVSGLKGVIAKANNARNIRLRCENIQLGDESACLRFLPNDKQRFVRWFFGEIHVISSEKLIPNSQRDYLREDDAVREFECSVENNFLKLEKLCYQASHLRNEEKTVNITTKREEELIKKREKGFNSENEQRKVEAELKDIRKKKTESIKKLQRMKKEMDENESPLRQLFSPLGLTDPQEYTLPESNTLFDAPSVTKKEDNLRIDKSIYNKFTSQEKKLIASIYSIIADTFSNNMGDVLIEKIEKEITK
ncbi:MAG: ATP-binding protein [Bacteroidales bacterium]|nr:ATP-binding protein [Bacteroidales bacterium]